MRALEVDRELVEPLAVGASEVGAVMGCDPWTTPLQLYRRKKGLDDPRPDNAAMALGRALEGPVVDLARELIPLRIRRNARTFAHVRSPLFATPDAFVGRDRLLEVKVVGLRSPDAFDDDLPCRVKLQAQAQLAVTQRDAVYVAQLVGTELRLTLVESDPVAQLEILETAERFVDAHLQPSVPPDPLTWEERWADLLEAELEGELWLAGGPAQQQGDRLLEIRRTVKQLEDEERQLRLELLELLTAAGGAKLLGSGWTATVADRAGSVNWAQVALELGAPLELVERHRGPSSRTFTLRSSSRDS
jgi:predicted phage-related endonuclease